MVSQLTWMTPASKARALEKIHKMDRAIGFPEFVFDDAKLLKHFSGLNFTETDGNFVLMAYEVERFQQFQLFERLPVSLEESRQEFIMPAMTVRM